MGAAPVQNEVSYFGTTLTFGSAVASGDMIVVAVTGRCDGGAGATSVSDNYGNTYTLVVDGLEQGGYAGFATLFYAYNVTGGAGLEVTISFSSSPSWDWSISEWSGVTATDPLDVWTDVQEGFASGGFGGNTSALAQSNELVVSQGAGNSLSSGSGYTNLSLFGGGSGLEYLIASNTSPVGANNWSTGSTDYHASSVTAAFLPASGGGGGGSYTLNADEGIFTFTGESATLATSLLALAGSFTITGEPATLGTALVASEGSFAFTGKTATLAATLNAAEGVFAFTGEPATLGVALSAAAGSFTMTGEAAVLAVSLNASPGSFALAGQPATLATSLNAAKGSFATTGESATLGVSLVAELGVFTFVGMPIGGGNSRLPWWVLFSPSMGSLGSF